MAPYETSDQMESRLSARFGISATITAGDADIASDELDSMAPFIGYRLDESGAQARAFPRNINPDGTTNEEEDVPERVLDWVALSAYTLTASDAATPAVTSESIGSTSRTYATPKVSQTNRRMAYLIEPYLLKMGQRVGAASPDTLRTHESYPDYPLA